MKLLNLNNVTVQLGDAQVLKRISFSLGAGEVLAVVGANGSGKSSLLRAISGELPPQSGDIFFNDRVLSAWSGPARAQRLACLPQFSVLDFPFTVTEVIALGRIPHHSGMRRDEEIIDKVLASTDLKNLRHRLYPHLSGGEKRRVQIARVLAQLETDVDLNRSESNQQDLHGRLLLLDEPAAALDLQHQQGLAVLVDQLRLRGAGVVIVEHDLNLALRLADRVLALRGGEIAVLDTPTKVARKDIIKDVFDIDVEIVVHPTRGFPVVLQ